MFMLSLAWIRTVIIEVAHSEILEYDISLIDFDFF